MDSYVDITIRSSPEVPDTHLMSALFQKLHNALVKIDSRGIGVSFPKHSSKNLGNVLRLHGSSGALARLQSQNWMGGIADYIDLSGVRPHPPKVKFRTVQRVQAKSSPERLRRRAVRRHGIDNHTASQRVPDSAAEYLDLPYVRLASKSTRQCFPLFIRHGSLQDQPVHGSFSSYGLSSHATVPWF